METGEDFRESKVGHQSSHNRTWIKFDINPKVKEQFKKKCENHNFDMSTYLKAKINEFLMRSD